MFLDNVVNSSKVFQNARFSVILRVMKRLLIFSFPALFLVLFSCSSPEPKKADIVEKPEQVNKHVQKDIEDRLKKSEKEKFFFVAKDTLFAKKFIQEFYKGRDYAQYWSDEGKFSSRSDTLVSILKNARGYGLIPADYHFREIDSLRKNSRIKKFDAVKIAEADLLLTDAFFTFCVHLNAGRLNPDSLWREWRADAMDTTIRLIPLLRDSLPKMSFAGIFGKLEPPFHQYHALKNVLNLLQMLYHNYRWDTLPDIKKDTVKFYLSLKSRMWNDKLYDSTARGNDSVKLAKAIKKFQKKWNLDDDGKLGLYTYNTLKYSVEDRIRQVELNMERWRWEPKVFDKRYIWVNIPSYNLRVVEADTIVTEQRVITGAPDHPSPILNSRVSQIILNPYWRVPYKIATEEILPVLKYDTSYLRKKNFEVLLNERVIDCRPINWRIYNKTNFPYVLRQKEGDANALGNLKFMFPNKFDVYLHDTDARKLFGRHVRSLSHGCIRLDSVMILAKYLIRDDTVRIKMDTLKKYLDKKERKVIGLKYPWLPISIRYFTVDARDQGLQFYYDIYGRDEKMQYALYHDRKPRIMFREKKKK